MTSDPATMTVDGVTLSVSVERKRVKNVNARLRGSTLYMGSSHDSGQAVVKDLLYCLERRALASSPKQRS